MWWRFRPWRVAERPVFRGRAPDRDFVRRFFKGGVEHMYTTRPLFSRRGVAEYRQTIKERLRALAQGSPCCRRLQAAKLAGVARSTWQSVGRSSAGRAAGRGRAGCRRGRLPHRAGGCFGVAGHRPGGRGADRFRLRRRAEDRGERFLRAKKDKKCLLPHPLPVYTGCGR